MTIQRVEVGKIQRVDLPPKVVAAFYKLGDSQRGAPERALLRFNHFYAGVASPVFENAGDLTWRMTHHVKWDGEMDWEWATKVDKCLRYLQNIYAFMKEVKENIVNNAKYDNMSVEQYTKKFIALRQAYGKEHKKLVVYNEPQWQAREAAVSLGEWDLGACVRRLEWLQGLAKNQQKAIEACYAYTLDAQGEPKEYR